MQKTFNVFVPLKDVLRQIDVHYTPEESSDFIFQMSIEGAIEKRLRRDKISTGGAGIVCHLMPKAEHFSRDKLKTYAKGTASVFSDIFGKEKIGVKIALDPLFDGAVSRHIISLSKGGDDDEYAELAAALKSTPDLTSFEYVNEFLNSLDADKIAIWISIDFAPNQTIEISDKDFEISGAEQAWAMQGLESAIRFAAGLGRINVGLFPGNNSDITWCPKISMPTGLTFCLPRIHSGTLEIGENGHVVLLAIFKADDENYGYSIPAALLRYFKAAKWRLSKKGSFIAQRTIPNGKSGRAVGTIEFQIAPAPDDSAEA